MKIIKTLILLLLLGIAVVFTVQNMELVKLSFINYHIEVPLSLTCVVIYILGALSGGLLFSFIKKLTENESNKEENDSNKPKEIDTE